MSNRPEILHVAKGENSEQRLVTVELPTHNGGFVTVASRKRGENDFLAEDVRHVFPGEKQVTMKVHLGPSSEYEIRAYASDNASSLEYARIKSDALSGFSISEIRIVDMTRHD